MGQHQIVEKLRTEFNEEIASERQVVYILVEIGKLLEHEGAKERYPTITFYRDWAVHTKLDRSGLADSLVRYFDDYMSSGNQTASDQLKELVSPLTLQRELGSYLNHHDLNFPCCNDGVLWKRFVKYLAGVIDETPLHHKYSKSTKTKYIRSITVSRSRNQNGTAMLTWEAACHTSPPPDVETTIEVVLLADFDEVGLP